MGYNLLKNGVYWGYNPLTNLFLTSWDILVVVTPGHTSNYWGFIGLKRGFDTRGYIMLLNLQNLILGSPFFCVRSLYITLRHCEKSCTEIIWNYIQISRASCTYIWYSIDRPLLWSSVQAPYHEVASNMATIYKDIHLSHQLFRCFPSLADA